MNEKLTNQKKISNMRMEKLNKRIAKYRICYEFKNIEAKDIIYKLNGLWSQLKKAGTTPKKKCTSYLKNTYGCKTYTQKGHIRGFTQMVDKKDRTKNGPMTITTKSLDFQNKQK